MHRLMRLSLLVPITLLLACERPAPRTPEAGYRAFADAVRRGESKPAWAALTRPTQTALEARSKAISEASKGLIRDEPALMLLQSGIRATPSQELTIKTLSSDGGTATLEVAGSTGTQRITMIHDGDRWLVDLSDVLLQGTNPP
jgi:hypothetical protein